MDKSTAISDDRSLQSAAVIPEDLVKIVGNPADLERLRQDTLAII